VKVFFLAHSMRDRDLAIAIETHLRDDGHDALRHDEVTDSYPLSMISSALRSADVVIAIVSDGRPNVFFELGLASGAGVPTLIAAPPGESLPALLANVPYVQLTGNILRDAQTISRRVKDLEVLSVPRSVEHFSAEATLQEADRNPAILEALAPLEFERLVVELFRERGYKVSRTPPSFDTGIDIVMHSPENGQVLLVAVKKLSKHNRVSVEAVRSLIASVSLTPHAAGLLVATSGFTSAAMALAAGTSVALTSLDQILRAKSKLDLFPRTRPGADRISTLPAKGPNNP
jgi:HJR/Mrr/RecB family endonuclease